MGSLSKKANVERGEDRISYLPVEVLVLILSFLSTRDAFKTSLLSSRWENLWALVPNLSFTPCDWMTRGPNVLSLNFLYMNFIDRTLHVRDSSIEKFHLVLPLGMDRSRVNAWIGAVLKHNVREITVLGEYGVYGPKLRLPRSLFTCKTLEVLKFECLIQKMNAPSPIYLPSLKVLHVTFSDPSNELIEKLICSSPMLEELKLVVFDDSGKSNYIITSPALKKLSVCINAGKVEAFDSMVIIDAPVLEILEVTDNYFLRYTCKNKWSIIEANMDIHVNVDYGEDPQELEKRYMLLTSISHVKSLSLSYRYTWSDVDSFSRWPIFHNLTHLWLDGGGKFKAKRLPYLLRCAPNFTSLVFKNPVYFFHPPEDMVEPTCLRSSLREVEFHELVASQIELALIKYMLENAQILETLTVEFCSSSLLRKEGIKTEILAMPRCSKCAQVVFL